MKLLRRAQRWWSARRAHSGDYAARLAAEIATFEDQVNVHDLPPIFHYWSNRYLRPMFEQFGYSHPEDFFAVEIARARRERGRPVVVISLGAGNGDSELRIANLLRERDVDGVVIDCMDINPAMLARCAEQARHAGLGDVVRPLQGDFNRWRGTTDVVMANQSLHHVLELEHLFDAVHEAIGPDGVFLTCDMIGRNGHQRWPEARQAIDDIWADLPDRYRYNLQLRRHESRFLDWDCSVSGFEGIRAQDILPLLIERFAFDTFLAWGNIIDVFVDRSFGHHFDVDADDDRARIDRIHAIDDAGIDAGRWKPTHLTAVMRQRSLAAPRQHRHWSPAWCVRPPG
jgi:SAM-dependent methyltransferase